jgi:hypothetical protein
MRKPEGNRLLGRPRSRWENNIKIDLGGTGWDDVGWIDLAQARSVESILPYSICLISILILSAHLRLGFPIVVSFLLTSSPISYTQILKISDDGV